MRITMHTYRDFPDWYLDPPEDDDWGEDEDDDLAYESARDEALTYLDY